MAARAFLIAVLFAVAAPVIGQQPAPVSQAIAAVRQQISDDGIDGRFSERFTGSYVFAPQRPDWPQLPVANPEVIGVLAVGPPVRVRGQVDDAGRLTVANFILRPAGQLTESVRVATGPLVRLLGNAITRPAGTMSVESRSLPSPIEREEVAAAISEIVEGYQKALTEKNDAERRRFVDAWSDLRMQFVDAYSDSQEAKAIYGALDNYAPWRYDIIFRQAPGVVALGEAGKTRARCSGVLITADLVLTAAHCFAGEPKKKPAEIEAWIGYFETGITGKIADFQRRAITGLVSPPPAELNELMLGKFDMNLLDYAIVRIAPQDPTLPVPAPLCLRQFDMHRGEAVYVLGYPQGNPAMVHDSARIYLPHRVIDGDEFVRLRLDVETDLLRRDGAADLLRQFDASYVRVTIDGVTMRELRHVRDGGQPRIGIVADTFRGNSGGPVFDHDRNQCAVGILIGGSDDSGLRRTPNWKEHERVLPIAVVIEDLLRRKLDAVHQQLKIQ